MRISILWVAGVMGVLLRGTSGQRRESLLTRNVVKGLALRVEAVMTWVTLSLSRRSCVREGINEVPCVASR